jgi:hypothetical protein
MVASQTRHFRFCVLQSLTNSSGWVTFAMRYCIGGKLIASELAAKPPSQASRYLSAFLRAHKRVACAVDYGCGKLRYAGQLAAIADSLTLVDSPAQLDRQQSIDGQETTVRRCAERSWRTVRIETVSEFQTNRRPKFDLALCANVLSAIPTKTARSSALTAIRRRLKVSGSLLVVNQHTNSYYSQVARREDVTRHLDGWLVPRRNNSASYYGILDRKKIFEILENEGYEIIKHWIEGQSNYAVARIR